MIWVQDVCDNDLWQSDVLMDCNIKSITSPIRSVMGSVWWSRDFEGRNSKQFQELQSWEVWIFAILNRVLCMQVTSQMFLFLKCERSVISVSFLTLCRGLWTGATKHFSLSNRCAHPCCLYRRRGARFTYVWIFNCSSSSTFVLIMTASTIKITGWNT
jgi:hypothetical protein